MSDYKNTLLQEDRALRRLIAWRDFVFYGLFIMLLSFEGITLWYSYLSQIWLRSEIELAVWVVERLAVIFILLALMGQTKTVTKTLTRFTLEQNL